MEAVEVSDIFAALAILLSYPAYEHFEEQANAVYEFATVNEYAELQRAVEKLMQLPISQLEQHYVNTFDFQETTSLYLTAHERGDTRERGQDLLTLQQLLMSCGFTIVSGELPDYIPLLLEFLSQEQDHEQAQALCVRLAQVSVQIAGQLETDHPYRSVFDILVDVLPHTDHDQTTTLENPDLEDLPYPIMYD